MGNLKKRADIRNYLSIARNAAIFGGLAACFIAANLGLIPDGRLRKQEEPPQNRQPAATGRLVIREALTERPVQPSTQNPRATNARPSNRAGVAPLAHRAKLEPSK